MVQQRVGKVIQRIHLRKIFGATAIAGASLAATAFCFQKPAREQLALAQRLTARTRYVILDTTAPTASGQMCEWIPASTAGRLATMLQEQPASGSIHTTQDFSKRKPVRTIRDPYFTYSSVAVDPTCSQGGDRRPTQPVPRLERAVYHIPTEKLHYYWCGWWSGSVQRSGVLWRNRTAATCLPNSLSEDREAFSARYRALLLTCNARA